LSFTCSGFLLFLCEAVFAFPSLGGPPPPPRGVELSCSPDGDQAVRFSSSSVGLSFSFFQPCHGMAVSFPFPFAKFFFLVKTAGRGLIIPFSPSAMKVELAPYAFSFRGSTSFCCMMRDTSFLPPWIILSLSPAGKARTSPSPMSSLSPEKIKSSIHLLFSRKRYSPLPVLLFLASRKINLFIFSRSLER